MDKVKWQDGWPVVGVPSDSPQTAPVPELTFDWAKELMEAV